MKTEFLKELGLEQDIIDKIMAENGKDVDVANGELQAVTASVHSGNLVKINASNNSTISVGDKVKVLQGLQYSGQPFTVYYNSYDVIEVNGNRIVIGKNGVVTVAVNKSNLQKI